MRLWVANTTKKNVEFHYRLPEQPRPFVAHVPIGSQVPVHSGDLNSPMIDALIEQLRRYGAVPAEEVDRTREFIGLCYSVDTPVQAKRIQSAVEHNDDVLTERGQEIRTEAAVAIHEGLSQAANNPRDLAETTVEVREEAKRGETPRVDQTVHVSRDSGEAKPKRGRRKS